jgi:hypothetical protein
MGWQRVIAATAKVEEHRSRRTAIVGRVALLVVLGALLAGCDKCGDWWSPPVFGDAQACRQQAPRPQ